MADDWTLVVVFSFIVLVAGCSNNLHRCALRLGTNEWAEYVDTTGPRGERIIVSSCYATEASQETVGKKPCNCFRVRMVPPDGSVSSFCLDRCFLREESRDLKPVEKPDLMGAEFVAPGSPSNLCQVAMFLESAGAFPAGDGNLHVGYRIDDVDRKLVVACRLRRERVFYGPRSLLPVWGH